MNHPRNIWLFLRLLASDPVQFFDRAEIILQARKEKLLSGKSQSLVRPERICFLDALRALSRRLGRNLLNILGEPELQNVQSHVARLTLELETLRKLPFPVTYNADSTVAQLAYLLCRVLEPETALETGVAYGVTSAMILAALSRNGKGVLHSVDLPPIGDRASHSYIGMMIPPEHKNRWHLHLGTSRRVLPSLFAKGIGGIGLFIHDSANIRRVQQAEMDLVSRNMSPRAAMIVNNIGQEAALRDLVKHANAEQWLAIEQSEKKGALTGVILTH